MKTFEPITVTFLGHTVTKHIRCTNSVHPDTGRPYSHSEDMDHIYRQLRYVLVAARRDLLYLVGESEGVPPALADYRP